MLAMRQKVLDHTKESANKVFKTASKIAIQETAEATGDLIKIKLKINYMGFKKFTAK